MMKMSAIFSNIVLLSYFVMLCVLVGETLF